MTSSPPTAYIPRIPPPPPTEPGPVAPLPPTGIAQDELLQLELSDGGVPARGQSTRHPDGPHPAADNAYDPADPLAEDDPSLPGSRGEHLLQRAYGSRERAERFYNDQLGDHLNDEMIEFVRRMDMAFVATSDAAGETDCSLRAGPPGFIQVLGERLIAYPEYRGNGVLASLGNISENPHVGVLMVDFVTDLIGLHVNGEARIVEDADLRAEHTELPTEFDRGRTPERWVVVAVQEAYIHCRKHIPRMVPVERNRSWGTDDARRKGGDYFGVRASRQQDTVPHDIKRGA